MKINKKVIMFTCISLVVLIAALFSSYALFIFNASKNENFKVKIGTLELSILDTVTEDKFIMDKAVPTKDEVALMQAGYTFTLRNTGTINSYYTVYLDDILLSEGLDRLENNYIKFKLTNQTTNESTTGRLSDYPDRAFNSGFLNVGESITYNLKMWVDYSAGNSAQNKYYATQIRVISTQKNAVKYEERILNGTDPVLTNDLVPVMIANDGTVTKADTSNKWYSYQNKEWANAVVLKDNTITYNNGQTIPESNIESYFVWIPKYSYQLWDLGDYNSLTTITTKEHSIPIRFGLDNTTDTTLGECTTPTTSGSTGNCVVGDYMTHPAFLAFNTNGIWVGKFETGYDGAISTETAQANVSDTSKVIIKPNAYSWRYSTLGNMFDTSYNYLRGNESHMMKNTEWGAVAYLQHSPFGKNDEIYVNNTSKYLTGCGASTAGANGGDTCINGYNTASSYPQSTTGNITGIFDISGGAWEYIMGYTTVASTLGGASDITTLYSDFFTNNSWNKYYDIYTSENNNNRILGDATGELGPFETNLSSWYGDLASFPINTYTWFLRGGYWNDNTKSGAFSYNNTTGVASTDSSFRIVLAP